MRICTRELAITPSELAENRWRICTRWHERFWRVLNEQSCRLNLDTSVMVNYVYSQLPSDLEEDRGCQRLIDGESFYIP